MMATISFVIPCKSEWVEGIYQLEVTDRVTGYDPILAVDGKANAQATQLGSRTQYLLDVLNRQHMDGHHNLTENDFVEDTKIAESKLALYHGTNEIADMIDEVQQKADSALSVINNYNSIDISSAYLLSRLMPWCREYFNDGVDYELFNNGAMLRSFSKTDITRAIAGDDSLDVKSTKGIKPGNTYFLMNTEGGEVEEAEVLSVLTENRIRFTKSLTRTRTDGYLAATNLLPKGYKAEVRYGFSYVSDWIDTLVNAHSGRFFVHRDNVDTEGTVRYLLEGAEEWVEAPYLGYNNFIDGTIDDIYALPKGHIKVRVDYTQGTEGFWNIYYFALKAEMDWTLPEQVRRPKIKSATLTGTTFRISGDPFASLWGFSQKGLELRISIKNEYLAEPLQYSIKQGSSSICVNLPSRLLEYRPLLAEIRYEDEEGVKSRWSPSREII